MAHMVAGLANGDSTGFWDAAAQGRLMFQKCRACSHVQFPPRHLCAVCWSDDVGEVESAGTGEVESVTIVRRAPMAAFRARVPYAVAAIRLDDGPRMITNLVGPGNLDAAAGDRVVVTFEADDANRMLPQFRLVRADGNADQARSITMAVP